MVSCFVFYIIYSYALEHWARGRDWGSAFGRCMLCFVILDAYDVFDVSC